MCGIMGISFGEGGPDAEAWTPTEFMQIMFPAIVHRGPHAFGWMWYDGENVYYQKYAGKVSDPENLAKVGFAPDVDESKIKWLVCHVRYFTHGDPSNNLNNHPIQHGKILGVHNGVIRNYQEILDETGRHDVDTEVDSEAIFAAVDHYGHRAGLRKIRGDMVAIYTNLDKPATLHITRSDGRPLQTCKTPSGSYVFASEEKVIDATGITHTTYSPLSRNRLIRVRDGKVLERITVRKDAPQPNAWGGWRGTGDIPAPPVGKGTVTRRFPDRSAPSWFSETLRSQDSSSRQHQAQKLRDAAKDPRSRNLVNHDKFGDFYYLDGVLLTEEAYMQAIADMDDDVNKEGA